MLNVHERGSPQGLARKRKEHRVRNLAPSRSSQKGDWFRRERVFFHTSFRTLPQTRAGERAPKIVDFSSKSDKKVTRKLTHLSSLCSLRSICGELGDTKMAPSFALRVLSFSLRTHGESHARALAHIFKGAPMSRR